MKSRLSSSIDSMLFSRMATALTMSTMVACGGEQERPQEPTSQSTGSADQQAASLSSPTPMAANTPPGAPEVAPTPPAPPPPPPAEAKPSWTDSQILGIIRAANAGEMEQAKLAKAKAKDPKVKKFAEMMLKDHGDADAKAAGLAKKESSPAASDVRANLEADAKSNTTAMSAEKGNAFDKAYIDAQVKEHDAVLKALDAQLIPSAHSEDVKSLLGAVRGKVAHHLDEAKELQKKLSN